MRTDRKKEKMVGYNVVPTSIPGVSNGVAVSSAGGVTKQEKISYNACPPPANLYPSGPSPAVVSPYSAKTGNGAVSLSGNTSDGERKGRRRPGRKSRQVVDSSAFPLSSSDSCLPSAAELEGSVSVGQITGELRKQENVSSHLPSPNPSVMPNPSFKDKSVPELSSSLSVPKSASRAVLKNVDKNTAEHTLVRSHSQSEQYNSSSSKSSVLLACPPSDASCIVEPGGGQKAKNKEALATGTPKPKSRDSGKSMKSSVGPASKKSASLGVDPKLVSQKGWRMCTPPGITSSSCSGSFDVPVTSGISCAPGEVVEVISPSGGNSDGAMQDSSSWPESSVPGAPASCMNGRPEKLVSGGATGITYGCGMSRFSQFSEHLSTEDALHCIEEGHAFRGVLRVNPHYRSEAYVTLDLVPVDILIDGTVAQNRAMEGDVVAVQLNPASQWPRLKGTNNKQSSASGVDETNIRVPSLTDYDGSHASADLWLEHEPSGFAECSAIINGEANLEDNDRLTLTSSGAAALGGSDSHHVEFTRWTDVVKNGLCVPGTDKKTNEILRTGQLKGAGCNKEVVANGKLESATSSSNLSLLNVAALIESMPGKRPTGRIVAIIEKSMRRKAVVGFLEIQGSSYGGKGSSGGNESSPQKSGKKVTSRGGGILTFTPVDNRFSKMIVFGNGIPEQLSKRLKDGDSTVSCELVVAQVEGWKANSSLPCAVVKQSLGLGGTIEAQTEAILFENAIHCSDFEPAVLACLPEVPWKIPEKELKERRDLRGFRIFTIDPPTAKDLDDAVSFEQLEGGNMCIGVHIADVSYFVHPDSALDKEAQKRSTSVYLIQRVLPMLPPLLCEELCSLNPGVDRLAFSVLWIMDPAGNIVDQWVGRSVICSCAKLSYGHAQSMIDGTGLALEDGKFEAEFKDGGCLPVLHGEHTWQDVKADVRRLHEVAMRLRENRFDDGALKLENSKLVFTLDEDGEPYESMMYQHQDSNALVEEFMLLANMTIARVISSAYPERALLRRHPEPNIRKLKEFEEFCTKNGFDLDTSSSGALHLSLEKMREIYEDDPVLFNILMLYATKPMQLAKYFCTGDFKGQEEEWAHYALAVPLYTHFTSPIRRYSDLVVHRTVAAALEAERLLSKDGLLSWEKGTQYELAGFKSLQCFSGSVVDKDIGATEAAQKALTGAAERHKIPKLAELSLVADHCNERRLASRNVKEASDKLYLWTMVKKKQGVLSNARVLALGPKFMSLYVCKIAVLNGIDLHHMIWVKAELSLCQMERRIYYDEIEGLNAEWFEGTGTLVLNLSSEKVTHRKYGQARGRVKRTVADVAFVVNPTDSNSEEETYEDLIREVEDRLAGKIISEDECVVADKEDGGSDMVVEPAVLPLTLRWFSTVPVSIHAIGGENRPLDIAVRLYVSSYAT